MEYSALNQSGLGRELNFQLEFDIEEDVEAELEEFILLRHMGRFHDARQLYNECLASHQDRFLVLAEYGYCLLQGGSYGRFIHEITPARIRDPKERETILFTLAGLTDRKEMAVILLMRLYAEYASGVSNYDYYNESLEKNESIDETIFLYERYSKDLNNRGVKRIITMAKTMSLLWADTGIDLSSLSYTDTEVSSRTLA